MSNPQERTSKCATACTYCRMKKIKCSGGIRCKNCFDHDELCFYPTPMRRKAKRAAKGINSVPGQESTLSHARLREHQLNMQINAFVTNQPQTLCPNQDESQRSGNNIAPLSASASNSPFYMLAAATPTIPLDYSSIQQPFSNDAIDGATSQTLPLDYSTAQRSFNNDTIDGSSSEAVFDKEESTLPLENINWEHHGPGSWLSICSNPGIKWVCERTADPSFYDSAQSLIQGWTKRIKLQGYMSRERAPELDAETAWKYTRSHFDECPNAFFGIVHRPTFEARLNLQFSQGSAFEDEVSWYALRNVIYASGYRVILSKDTSLPFVKAQAQAWRYFENAMSVHIDLLYTPTSLIAVQALALMTVYVEGIGGPILEFMLCSCLVRLAQSKGLHRQPAKDWNLPESEIIHRNWLFWAIYCLEKAIINRSGRPSAIDDDDINCLIPTTKILGSTIDVELFTQAIKHAKIASQISRRLASARAFKLEAAEMIETVQSLDRELREWRDLLPDSLKLGDARKPLISSSTRSKVNLHYLHFCYYGSMIAIHTVFNYPWIAALFCRGPTNAFHEQVAISTETAAEAARNIILTTKHIDLDLASPAWLGFYYPMVGLINLFVSILKAPASPVTRSDTALMEVAAGHFGHLDFFTASEMNFPFTREVANLARATVNRAKALSAANVEDSSWDNSEWSNVDATFLNTLCTLPNDELGAGGWDVFSIGPLMDTQESNGLHGQHGRSTIRSRDAVPQHALWTS